MPLPVKELLGCAATLLAIIAFIPYIRSILRGTTKPHVFSWVIWSTTTLIVFLAQLSDHAGPGGWAVGVSGAVALYIALLAYNRTSDHSITTSDWIFFIAAIAAIPCWYITSSALSAVLLLTAIDIAGYGPTLRKAYHAPFEEQALLYALMCLRNLISIAALEHYSLTTVLFPVATFIANMLVISIVFFRRRKSA